MPKWMRRYLYRKTLKEHLRIALVSGLFLRLLSAYFVFGPQALDDYKHGVWPAYQFFAGQKLDLPDYRSHLLVWVLAFFVKVGSWFGISSAVAQVQTMYVGLGVISLLGILGTYLYVRTFRSKLFASLALYLMAIFPLMPFVSTRAFGEAVALPLVALGLGILEDARRRNDERFSWLCLGFLSLGLATLFRFQAGLIYVAYLLVVFYFRRPGPIVAGLVSGLATLGLEILTDLLSGKGPLGTLIAYLHANAGGAAQYGASPWYNPSLFLLGITLAPFSFVLLRSLPGLWRRHWPVLIPFLVFVIAHSLVPHKEERFMYPVLAIEFWALAYLWSANTFNRLSRKLYSPILLGLSIPLLFVCCFVNSQDGEIGPPAYAEQHFHHVIYLDYQSLFGQSRYLFYFLRPPSLLKTVQKEEFNAHEIEQELADHRDEKAVVLLTSEHDGVDELRALAGIQTPDVDCGGLRTAGSVIDRLLYALNPKHNQRRRPTWYLVCERK